MKAKYNFLKYDKPLFTVMVQADNPKRIKELMDVSVPDGAEAFGIQFEKMRSCYRTKDVYRELFSHAEEQPSYITNYRYGCNEGKSDEQLAEELLEIADCGAELCDVMGDYFDAQPEEITYDVTAVNKQKKLIGKLHEKGSKVLMSSHIFRFTPAEEILQIALEHQKRGADISKIVSGADTMEQQLENLKIIDMLKNKLDIPFLFLSSGECSLLRRVGAGLGSCMYLCVHEHDSFATPQQPLLRDVKLVRDVLKM